MIASITALGRVGVPDDIGGVVAFLCSEDGRWVNAQRLEASGGIFFIRATFPCAGSGNRPDHLQSWLLPEQSPAPCWRRLSDLLSWPQPHRWRWISLFFFGPHSHDMVSFGIYPDAARFIGIDSGFQHRGDITAWMGCWANRPYFLDLNGSGLQ